MPRVLLLLCLAILAIGTIVVVQQLHEDRRPILDGRVLSKSYDVDASTGARCEFQLDIFDRDHGCSSGVDGLYTALVDSATYDSLTVNDPVRFRLTWHDSTQVELVP